MRDAVSAACSLREAVQSANLNLPVGGCTPGDPGATDRISSSSSTNGSAILLSAGTLSTTSDLEIIGNGPTQTIVDGGGTTQPFLISGGATALLQDLTIVNGRAINGGAVSNAGSLVLVNSSISGSSVTLGGAVVNAAGVVSVFNSTLSGNSATNGGAIYNDAGGAVSLTASTLSGNSGGSAAGGIFNFSTGTVSLRGTLLDTGATGANCAGTIESFGSNVADDATCFAAAGTDQVVGNVRIGPLADNGGPTRTHALAANSPAVDAVQGACTSDGSDGGRPLATDQRGAMRPSLGRGNGPARCDVGAYELLSAGELQFSERAYRVGEEGPAATITVVRTGGDAGPAGATLTLSGGTATLSEDYSGATFSVLFADGETSKLVLLPIVDDQLGNGRPDDRRRRPDAEPLSRRRHPDGGKRWHDQLRLHRHPEPPQRPAGHGDGADRRRPCRGAGRLRSRRRHDADLRADRDQPDLHRPGRRRRPERVERDVPRHPEPAQERRDRRSPSHRVLRPSRSRSS